MPFNFPDPAVETTVTNPLTGATYQWKADPGKWVLSGGPSPDPGPDPDQERQDNEIDNIEQLQRELHAIVSDSVYFYPGFGLEGQLPASGEYLPYEYTSKLDGGGIEKPTYFKSPAEEYESITHMRISAVAGPNGHLERAEAGDTMYIQHVGNDSGGKYTITQIDVEGAGPTGYFEIYVEFVEGFSDGNIEHPGYDQIQVVSKDLLSAARKEAFTRFYEAVDPATYNSGNDGTCVLVGAATINAITNVKLSGNDNQGKVRYIYKVNEDILIEDERNGAYAVLRVTAVNVAGDYDVELEHYNGVANIDFGRIYAFGSAADRGAIPDVGDDTHQPGTLDDRYVNEKGGDSMQGPLTVTGGRNPNADGIESTIKVLNVDSGQNSSLNLKHNGATQIYVGSTQTSFQGDIKFNAGGRAIYSGSDKKAFVINDGGVFYDGAYTVDRHVATKKNVDDVKDSLYQDIIELEEEINAIAPSLEYGTWKFGIPANAGRPPSNGTFYLLDGVTYTNEYDKVTGIAIHNNEYVAPGDTDPVDNHTWADADVGELIQLFDSADPDFFLGKITAKNVDVLGECVYLTVDRIQSSGVPNDNADPATGEFLTRVNIFKEPSGGSASEFVKKIGDTMTGDLAIDVSEKSNDIEAGLILKGSRSTHTNSAATIKFDNEQSTQKGYLTYRAMGTDSWFAFNRSLDLNNNGLHSVGQIRMQPGLNYIGAGNASRIKINNGSNTEAGTEIQRPGDGKRTFAIKGKSAGSGDVTDFFWVYGNGGTGGDAVNYTGKMTSNDNIVNKGYVDSKVGGIDIDCNATGRNKGDMWYCPTDQVLYIKVS